MRLIFCVAPARVNLLSRVRQAEAGTVMPKYTDSRIGWDVLRQVSARVIASAKITGIQARRITKRKICIRDMSNVVCLATSRTYGYEE